MFSCTSLVRKSLLLSEKLGASVTSLQNLFQDTRQKTIPEKYLSIANKIDKYSSLFSMQDESVKAVYAEYNYFGEGLSDQLTAQILLVENTLKELHDTESLDILSEYLVITPRLTNISVETLIKDLTDGKMSYTERIKHTKKELTKIYRSVLQEIHDNASELLSMYENDIQSTQM